MIRRATLAFVSSLAILTGYTAAADAPTDCTTFNSAAFFAAATPEQVAHCLEEGASLLPPGAPEDRPLFHAVRNATTPVVLDVLLVAAADRDELDDVLKAPGADGRSILHVAAAEARDPAMITWLVAWGADVWARFDCGDGWFPYCTQPIHLAARRQDGFLFLATLMALGADASVPDRDGRTLTALAMFAGADRWNNVALLGASDWPSESARLVALRPDPTAPCDRFLTPGFFASETLAQLTHCLDEGASAIATDQEGNTALHHAAAHSADPRLVDLLLVRLHQQDPSAVERALQRTNNARMPPLHHAARHGASSEAIVRLIAWGADPNALAEPIETRRMGTDRGTTPLHLAARNTGSGREAILTVLLAAGASPTLQDHGADGVGGRQALHYLMRHDPDVRQTHLVLEAEVMRKGLLRSIVDYYVRRQVSVVSDDAGATALHVAALFGAGFDVFDTLLWYGFSPDARDRDGMTPLMLAAGHATDPEVFFLLLEVSETPCRTSPAGHSVPALLRANEALQILDPTGRQRTPLEAYRDRCP